MISGDDSSIETVTSDPDFKSNLPNSDDETMICNQAYKIISPYFNEITLINLL